MQSTFSTLFRTVLILQICSIAESQYPYPPPQMPNYQGQQIQAYPQMQQMPMPMGPGMGMQMPPVPMPMPIAMSQPRLPVVVMPFRNQKNDKESKRDGLRSSKRRKHHKRRRKSRSKHKLQRMRLSSVSESSSDERSSSASSELEYRDRKTRRSKPKRHSVLTPVISYVTNDGYVVYQKKIKKDKAKEWLDLGNHQDQALDSGEKTATSMEVGKDSGKGKRY